jgi:hypothetical protein
MLPLSSSTTAIRLPLVPAFLNLYVGVVVVVATVTVVCCVKPRPGNGFGRVPFVVVISMSFGVFAATNHLVVFTAPSCTLCALNIFIMPELLISKLFRHIFNL